MVDLLKAERRHREIFEPLRGDGPPVRPAATLGSASAPHSCGKLKNPPGAVLWPLGACSDSSCSPRSSAPEPEWESVSRSSVSFSVVSQCYRVLQDCDGKGNVCRALDRRALFGRLGAITGTNPKSLSGRTNDRVNTRGRVPRLACRSRGSSPCGLRGNSAHVVGVADCARSWRILCALGGSTVAGLLRGLRNGRQSNVRMPVQMAPR
jgi:hypothetical protein